MRLSVVVPVHNEEDFIAGCLDALLAQREPVHEIIVVDNNSDDRTGAVLRPYRKRVLILREARQGVQFARGAGMDAATGELIGRIDADTRVPPDWSRRVREAFADPSVQAVTGPAGFYDVRFARLLTMGDMLIRRAWSRRMDWIFGANMAVRAGAWRAVRDRVCLGPEVHEDLDLGLHLHDAGLRIVFDRRLRAATSARRIAAGFRDYRAYLLMNETGYRRHNRPRSRRRAWLTARLLLAVHFPLRFLYAAHSARTNGTSVLVAWRRLRARRNPMNP